MRDVAADAERFRSLHMVGAPVILANAWDPPTARLVEEAGLGAVATSSGAVAAVSGYRDGGELPVGVAFGAVARIAAAVGLPVSADIEDGYGLAAGDLVERLVSAGACGCNVEDTDHASGGLVDAGAQADRLHAIKEAGRAVGIDLVLNARVDVYLQPTADHDEALDRARRYWAAGADCVYPIRLGDLEVIRALASEVGPVNVFYRPRGPGLAELAAAGVSRISLGGGLFRLGLDRVRQAIGALAGGHDPFG